MTNLADTSKEAIELALEYLDATMGGRMSHSLIETLAAERDTLQATVKEMREALETFVERCEKGTILSSRTYKQFKAILAKHKEQDHE